MRLFCSKLHLSLINQKLIAGCIGRSITGQIDGNSAKVINRAPKLGTLQIGAPADVAIMELVEGDVSFVDTRNNIRTGRAYLKPVQTIAAGVPFGRPYNSPFAVR